LCTALESNKTAGDHWGGIDHDQERKSQAVSTQATVPSAPGAGAEERAFLPPAAAFKAMSSSAAWPLIWAARCSQIYHARRCAFYDRMAKVSDFLSIIGATTALTAIGSYFPKWAGVWGSFLVVIASSMNLVVGASAMARKHEDLKRRFGKLEARALAVAEPSESQIAAWMAERVRIEVDEPPTYWALNVMCERECARARTGFDESHYRLPWYKAATCNWFLWRNS
jgi:hypothetical protein